MGTSDRKNRATREEKGVSMSSYDNSGGKGAGQDPSSSLAARRARLRGSLAKADSFAPAGGEGAGTAAAQSKAASAPATEREDKLPKAEKQAAGPAESNESVDNALKTASGSKAGASSKPAEAGAEPANKFYSAHTPEPGPQAEGYKSTGSTPKRQVTSSSVKSIADSLQAALAGLDDEPEAEVKSGKRQTTERKKSQAMELPDIGEPPAADTFKPIVNMDAASLEEFAGKSVELLSTMDQSLIVCATNLAALQNLSVEQADVLKGLSASLQNQALTEISMNLNSLSESMAAALEPVKSMGELIPALDQLITVLEGKPATHADLSPEDLLSNLADQLSAGLIDPWTFKCAYMAVYPGEDTAELLHRLVELLGTQRLTGDLFRAAYEAVKSAEPPPRLYMAEDGSGEVVRVVQDEALKAQVEALERANRELQRRMEERERELLELVASREAELHQAHGGLESRLDDLNKRYEEASEILSKREEEFNDLLRHKEAEIADKESELNLLRAQMEELRVQTEEMVKDLQREFQEMREVHEDALSRVQEQNAPGGQSGPGFFDQPSNPRSLFEGASKPLFGAETPSAATSQPMAEPGRQEMGGPNFGGNFAAPAPSFGQPPFGAPASSPAGGTFAGAATASQGAFATPQVAFGAPAAGQQAAPEAGGQGFVDQSSSGQFSMPSRSSADPASGSQSLQKPALPASGPATTPLSSSQSGSYGTGVRAQVFEVIVRQALAGAPWREICAGPMQVNNISPDEVEEEVKRRQALLNR